jgi:hypothetical protein
VCCVKNVLAVDNVSVGPVQHTQPGQSPVHQVKEKTAVWPSKVHKKNHATLGGIVLNVVPQIVVEDHVFPIVPRAPLAVHFDEAVLGLVGHLKPEMVSRRL